MRATYWTKSSVRAESTFNFKPPLQLQQPKSKEGFNSNFQFVGNSWKDTVKKLIILNVGDFNTC